MHLRTFPKVSSGEGGREENKGRTGQTRLLLCSVSSSFHSGLLLDDSDVEQSTCEVLVASRVYLDLLKVRALDDLHFEI